MGNFIHFLQYEVEKPTAFSPFHILVLFIVLATTTTISVLFRNSSEKTYKRIILITWISCIILEIFKQMVKGYNYETNTFKLSLIDFPFHLCSMIYYVAPILIFAKREKHPFLYDMMVGFTAFFIFIGGLVVIAMTGFVLSNLLYTNIQSMVHHGCQVMLGIFIVVWNRKYITIKTFLRSLIVLGIYTVLAILVNVLFTPLCDYIDMFYVNPFKLSPLPIISVIQEKAGFIPYLIVYLLLLISAGFIVYFIEMTIIHKFKIKEIFKLEQ